MRKNIICYCFRITSPFTSYRRSEEKESPPPLFTPDEKDLSPPLSASKEKDSTPSLSAPEEKDSPPPLSAPEVNPSHPLLTPTTPQGLFCPPYQDPPAPYSGDINKGEKETSQLAVSHRHSVRGSIANRTVSGSEPFIAYSEHSAHHYHPSHQIITNESLSCKSEQNDAMTPKSEEKKSSKSLSRSDSYRRARPLLSPVEVRKTRNSSDVTNLDFSSINIQDEKEEKKESKGNFFKNIRSQFTFSSLRRKSPKKNSNKDDSYRTSGCDPTHDLSPSVGARMTSTPLSSCTAARGSEVREGPEEVKYRTAAMKNQHQRWSFAEQTAREGINPYAGCFGVIS